MIEGATGIAGSQQVTAQDTSRAALREQATKLEAFLFTELLRVADTGKSPLTGAPESQFQSLLREKQAKIIAGSGQTGLAESIYRSLAKGANL